MTKLEIIKKVRIKYIMITHLYIWLFQFLGFIIALNLTNNNDYARLLFLEIIITFAIFLHFKFYIVRK